MFVYVAQNIWSLLEEESLRRLGNAGSVDLRFADQVTTRGRLANLQRFWIVHTNVALGFPLVVILVKAIEVARSIVQKDAMRCQVGEDLGRFELWYCLKEPTLLVAIDHVERLLTDRTEMHEQLHTDTAGEKGLVRCLAHFKQELDSVIFLLPGQHVRVTLNNDDIYQVETLLVMLRIRAWFEVKEVITNSESITCIDLRRSLQLQACHDFF